MTGAPVDDHRWLVQVHAVCTCNLHDTIITDKDIADFVGKTLTQSEKYEALKSITVPANDYKFPVQEFKTKAGVRRWCVPNGILQYSMHILILYYYIFHYTGASYTVG